MKTLERMRRKYHFFFILKALLLETDMSKQDDNNRLVTIMKKGSSATGEIYGPLKHTIKRVLPKPQSILESSDHPLHNVLSQHDLVIGLYFVSLKLFGVYMTYSCVGLCPLVLLLLLLGQRQSPKVPTTATSINIISCDYTAL